MKCRMPSSRRLLASSGGQSVLGAVIRSQADLALAVRNRLPLTALKGLTLAGLSEQEIEKYVIPQRTRRHRADKTTADGG